MEAPRCAESCFDLVWTMHKGLHNGPVKDVKQGPDLVCQIIIQVRNLLARPPLASPHALFFAAEC